MQKSPPVAKLDNSSLLMYTDGMKIWARLMNGDKIAKDTLYKSSLPLTMESYELWLRDICHILDAPNPVVIEQHYKNFKNFHNTKFRQCDFIETLDYDMLIVEDCKED